MHWQGCWVARRRVRHGRGCLGRQKTQGKRELVQAEIHKREKLYGEFIGECSRLLMDALSHNLEEPQKLVTAYSS